VLRDSSGEDLHDGASFEMFLDRVEQHPRCNILFDPSHFVLQSIDYLAFMDIYHDRIKMVHVKDAEFNPNGRMGAYGGYQSWVERAGRFRSLGDGQVDFRDIRQAGGHGFRRLGGAGVGMLSQAPGSRGREGAAFIGDHIIQVTDRAFDDFADASSDEAMNRKMLGIGG
jgi:hypothetical protein